MNFPPLIHSRQTITASAAALTPQRREGLGRNVEQTVQNI